LELEEFGVNCLSLEAIKYAAKERARQHTIADVPQLTIVNMATGQSRTIVMDVSRMIAEGDLYVTRGIHSGYRQGDEVMSSGVELGEFLKQEAFSLGIDTDNIAVVGKVTRHDELWPADIFSSRTNVSSDFWSGDGEYSDADAKPSGAKAPSRHSLYDGDSFKRVNSYDADDFLDAAQGVVSHAISFIRETSGSEELRLQPLEPLAASFHKLRHAVENSGYELGYSLNGLMMPPVTNITAVRANGRIKKYLSMSPYGARLGIENSIREFERWKTPIVKRIGRLITQKPKLG
jgi:hypothetical protein